MAFGCRLPVSVGKEVSVTDNPSWNIPNSERLLPEPFFTENREPTTVNYVNNSSTTEPSSTTRMGRPERE